MIWAVRIHPEAAAEHLRHASPDAGRRGDAAGLLPGERRRSRGTRISSRGIHTLSAAAGGSVSEVCAESWPGQNMIDSCIDCVDSWRHSSGHWQGVSGRHRAFGYDIRRGRQRHLVRHGDFCGLSGERSFRKRRIRAAPVSAARRAGVPAQSRFDRRGALRNRTCPQEPHRRPIHCARRRAEYNSGEAWLVFGDAQRVASRDYAAGSCAADQFRNRVHISVARLGRLVREQTVATSMAVASASSRRRCAAGGGEVHALDRTIDGTGNHLTSADAGRRQHAADPRRAISRRTPTRSARC